VTDQERDVAATAELTRCAVVSQTECARRLGISQQMVARIERRAIAKLRRALAAKYAEDQEA
jgi:predicted DNA-binding protein (UPF0251 family)